jgi:arabinogalactan endo-1,4-beta-galactosidase
MEATDIVFYDTEGKDCLQLLKNGMEYHSFAYLSIRSQDKASGHCSAAETVVMALRAQKSQNAHYDRFSL